MIIIEERENEDMKRSHPLWTTMAYLHAFQLNDAGWSSYVNVPAPSKPSSMVVRKPGEMDMPVHLENKRDRMRRRKLLAKLKKGKIKQ